MKTFSLPIVDRRLPCSKAQRWPIWSVNLFLNAISARCPGVTSTRRSIFLRIATADDLSRFQLRLQVLHQRAGHTGGSLGGAKQLRLREQSPRQGGILVWPSSSRLRNGDLNSRRS